MSREPSLHVHTKWNVDEGFWPLVSQDSCVHTFNSLHAGYIFMLVLSFTDFFQN